LYERQLSLFKVGQKIAVGSQAFPNKTYQSVISFIQPVLDTKTRTVAMRVVLQNGQELLKPGMFVEGVAMLNEALKTPISIPTTAVLWTGKRSVVYLKTTGETPVFEMKEVVLGVQSGDRYPVVSGLNLGDEIVTNGTFTVDAAAQLQGKKSMMNQKEETNIPQTKEAPKDDNLRKEVSPAFQAKLGVVFKDYLTLKDALVSDAADKASKAAAAVLASLTAVPMELLKEAATHRAWMQDVKQLKVAASAIAKTSDIGVQRNQFKELSNAMIHAVQLLGVGQKAYKQFCPMANSNEGAYWLSLETDIKNPYYGAAMLRCGEVKETIN
jgi:membrane fusion protein, copper/silver efflux system